MKTLYGKAAIAASIVSLGALGACAQGGADEAPTVKSSVTRLTDGTVAKPTSLPKASPRSQRSVDAPRALRGARAPRSLERRSRSSGTAAPEVPAVLYGGGPVTTAPKVVPVIFPGNALDAQIRDFLTKLPGSAYWQAATSEYGVGPITTLPAYVPTGAVPDASSVDQWIADLAGNASSGLPAPDGNTIYAVVLPQGWGADAGACTLWGAYHSANYTSTGQMVVHTVNPTCAVPYLGLSGIDQITDALSHEIEESATDPDAYSGYTGVNWAASGWGAAGEGAPGSETADMCEFEPNADYKDPQIGYVVQRSWSNQAAAGGHDPCRPLLPGAGPYFTADPVLTEGTQVSVGTYALGVSIAPGREVTIAVRLRSDGPVGEWALSAEEQPDPHLAPDIYGELSFSWDRASGRAGDTRHLTIRRAPPPDASAPVFLRVAINSTLGSVTHTSWLVVGTE